MSVTAAPRFSCPSCGKQFRWKPEMAGKKAKCSCGGVVAIPATPPAPPPPPPPPPPESDRNPLDDPYSLAEEPVHNAPTYAPAAPPPPTVMRPAKSAPATAAADQGGGEARQLRVGPALKWIGIGVVATALAVWEFSDPTDPDAPGRKRGIRAIMVLANHIHPRGAFFVLAAFAAFMLVVGVLILLGKAKDDDSEHERNKDQWPASRGQR